jgi:hypothetical protein
MGRAGTVCFVLAAAAAALAASLASLGAEMKVARRFWVSRWSWLAAGGVIGAVAVAAGLWSVRPPQITLWMRPVHSLTLAACAEEAHQFGYSLGAGRGICRPGAGGSWYRAALVNRGSYTQVSCSATGYGAGGVVLFSGPLAFGFGGPRGLFAPARWAQTFTWYLPRKAAARVRAYQASCTASPYP